MFPELLSLPIVIQLSLASGYAAYHFAYVGIREHHKTIDVAFITLAFGLIATAVFSSLIAIEEHLKFAGIFGQLVAGLAAFLAAVFAAVIWRKYGRDWLQKDLRNKDISWANDDVSALRTISSSTSYFFTQVTVELIDGKCLITDNTSLFEGAPYAPFALGQNGDLAIYLTHEENPKTKKIKKFKTVRSPDCGDCMTYVPANQIRRMTFRLKKKP